MLGAAPALAAPPAAASAVLFLKAPRGPGQGLHPSWVSLGSSWQVGYGSQVPSGVHEDLGRVVEGQLPDVRPDGALEGAEAAGEVEGAVAGDPGAVLRLLLLHPGVVLDAPRDVRPGAVSLARRVVEQVGPEVVGSS